MSDYTLLTQHHGLLGTVVELVLVGVDEDAVHRMEELTVGEIRRLQAVFNVHDHGSRISRWRRGEETAGPEITTVLAMAEQWHAWSRGAFDPYIGGVRELWSKRASEGRVPTKEELASALADRETSPVDLNAIAKGWIIDRSSDIACDAPGAVGVTVNAGGDIRHFGTRPLRVAIENPHRPYDNVAPLATVRLESGAIATSGGARRGWEIGERWYSHVIDPRSGLPADHVAQVSVLAPTAAIADAAATALSVLHAEERETFIDRVDAELGYLIVSRGGAVASNPAWDSVAVS